MLGIVGVIITGSITFGILALVQDATDANIRQSLFEQQKERQIETTRSLAQHVASDMDSILSKLEAFSNIMQLQQGDLSSVPVRQAAQEYFDKIKVTALVDHLYVIDRNGIIKIDMENSNTPNRPLQENNLSPMGFIQQTLNKKIAILSEGYQGTDGKYRISLTYPIINRENGNLLGIVTASLATIDFFAQYGNIYHINSQYLAALDLKGNQLVHGKQDLIGKNFFGNYTQQFTQHNADLNTAMHKVLTGEPAFAVYSIQGAAERLTTGDPIFVRGNLAYAVFVITPTSVLYSQIDQILADERTQVLGQQLGLATAIGIFMAFALWLSKNLNKEVNKRTQQLKYSNLQLAHANDQLRTNDKLQKEFINIAAHELRTPIQPILGASEIIEEQFNMEDGSSQKIEVTRSEIDLIHRNAKRLERLSSTLLEAAQIESQSLKLYKKAFDINEKIAQVITDTKTAKVDSRYQSAGSSNISITFEPRSLPIIVNADEERITEVISNLVSNATKFTREGSITVTSQIKDDNAIITIRDSGDGIDSDMHQKLFTKFATKSEIGTGLGLYISKSIIEAHGGKMWAQNNPDGKGATFTFIIPLRINSSSNIC